MDNEKPILSLLQQIQTGAVNPKDIDKAVRQQIVEALILEGSSPLQIAQILRVSDKTIRRDISAIRGKNALMPNLELAKRIIGDMMMKADAHRTYLMRVARTQKASVSEKSQAEYLAWKITEEQTKILQSLGYLPLRPKEIVGDFFHHVDSEDDISLEALKNQIIEIEKVAAEHGGLDEVQTKQIDLLRHRIEKAQIEDNVIELQDKQEKGDDNNEEKQDK